MWKKEIARDLLALGSVPFYALVIARAFVGQFVPFIVQLCVALPCVFLLSRLIDFDRHVSRALVLLVFVSAFYWNLYFALFALAIYVLIVWSAVFLKKGDRRVIMAVVFGVVSSLVAYVASLPFM